jgi:uncharacterized protein YjbI with pentapeptide repeats
MEREQGIRLLQGGRRGIDEWNRMRRARAPLPNLKKCALPRTDLRRADLAGMNLRRSDLRGAVLCGAHLVGAALPGADLREARAAAADLRQADLTDADLSGADLSGTDLRSATLTRATLIEADLHQANLNGARLHGATCQATGFSDVNLSAVEGLESVRHLGPSEISISTVQRSSGRIPPRFLRGCGLPDWQVLAVRLYTPDLPCELLGQIQERMMDLRTHQGVQLTPLFVSHGDADAEVAASLEAAFSAEGLRCWLDPHSPDADPSDERLERILSLEPMVLVVLSASSAASRWLESEVRQGIERSRKLKRDVLWPVACDEAWKGLAHRDPFRRWFDWCTPLDLSHRQEPDLVVERLREFVQDRRLVIGSNLHAAG